MNQSKTILVLGGSGHTGKIVIARFLREGYTIHSLTRKPNKAPKFKEGDVKWFEGSLSDTASIKRAAQGCSAILSCVGADNMKHTTVYTDVYQNVVPIMQELKIPRIMMITTEKGNPHSPWMVRKIVNKMLKNIFENQLEAENMFKNLKDSEIKWTIVRLNRLTNTPYKPGAAIHANENNSIPDKTDWTSPMPYAAEFMLEELSYNNWVNKIVAVSKKRGTGCFA